MTDDRTIFDAIEFAAKAHAGQFRKGTKVPYIVHPLKVAKILIEHGCCDEVVVAGVLHDTIEDTEVTGEELRKRFGETVARLVEEASEPDKSDTWENRKQHTVEQLQTASPSALLLELADKIDNIRDIREEHQRVGELLWSRFKRSKAHQDWYYRALLSSFMARQGTETINQLIAEFKAEVEEVFGMADQ